MIRMIKPMLWRQWKVMLERRGNSHIEKELMTMLLLFVSVTFIIFTYNVKFNTADDFSFSTTFSAPFLMHIKLNDMTKKKEKENEKKILNLHTGKHRKKENVYEIKMLRKMLHGE